MEKFENGVHIEIIHVIMLVEITYDKVKLGAFLAEGEVDRSLFIQLLMELFGFCQRFCNLFRVLFTLLQRIQKLGVFEKRTFRIRQFLK